MSRMKELYEERKGIVDVINDILETTWTEDEFVHGKELDVPPSWRTHLKYLIQKYKEHGWLVTRNIMISSDSPHVRRDYMIFLNPTFLHIPREIRASAVRI